VCRGVLEHRQVVGAGLHLVGGGEGLQGGLEGGVHHHGLLAHDGAGHLGLLGVGHQQARLAVAHPQADAVRAEEGEQRHGDGAALDDAEHGCVEGPRGLQHDGHALAGLHALRFQKVSKARGIGRQFGVADHLVLAAGVGHDQGVSPAAGVPVHALVGNVEKLPIAIEQVPQSLGRELGLGIGVAGVVGQLGHGFVFRC